MAMSGRGYILVESVKNKVREPLVRKEIRRNDLSPIVRTYCAFWIKDRTNYYIEEFAALLRKKFNTDTNVRLAVLRAVVPHNERCVAGAADRRQVCGGERDGDERASGARSGAHDRQFRPNVLGKRTRRATADDRLRRG